MSSGSREALIHPASAARAGAIGCSTAYGQSSNRSHGSSRLGPGEQQPAHADRLDAERLEVVQPLGVPVSVVRGPGQPGVGQPELHVRRHLQDLTLHHVRVQPGAGHPAGQSLVPGLPGAVRPVAEDLAGAVRVQVVGGVPDQVLHQLVADVPGLPVGQPGLTGAWRRHHVRRVGGDQVEAAIPYGCVEGSVQQLRLDAVEGEGQLGELQGPAVDVGRGDRLGVGGQVQGLHAAARAEIERRGHRSSDRELGQRAGGRRQAEHEVGAHRRDMAVQARSEIGEHPEVGVLGGVRAQIHRGRDRARRLGVGQDPGPEQRGYQIRQCALGRGPVDRTLQWPQPDQGGQRVVPTGQRPLGGNRVVAGQGRVRNRTHRRHHPIDGVVRGRQDLPELGEQGGIEHSGIEHRGVQRGHLAMLSQRRDGDRNRRVRLALPA